MSNHERKLTDSLWLIGDGTHKGGLSGTNFTVETVAMASLETKGSNVEQDLNTMSLRELARSWEILETN